MAERQRILVTGAAGMLGSQLLLDAPARYAAIGTDLLPARPGAPPVELTGVDLTDRAAVERLMDQGRFAGVLHPAAYTAVDKAEEERELASRINALAPELLAQACQRRGLPLVVVSTDFVFDGQGVRVNGRLRPYLESDSPAPVSVYGATKLDGERRALAAHPLRTAVVRTQWLFGPRGNHFPGTMLRLAREGKPLKVVNDQVGCPTTTLELAPALWDVLELGGTGVFHAACEGLGSWYDLAAATFELAGLRPPLSPCGSADFPRPAKRPAYSAMDCSRLAALRGRRLAPWREALQRFMALEGLLSSAEDSGSKPVGGR
jgi:dTDP-4-dehydrorhamnose reductase